FSGLGYAREDKSRRSGPSGRGRRAAAGIVAHRSDEVKAVPPGRFTAHIDRPPEAVAVGAAPQNGVILPLLDGTDRPFGMWLGRSGGREGEVGGGHGVFVVSAGVWSGGLSECGSRDDGTRGAAAPPPVNIETWRDLSSGRPRAARIILADKPYSRRLPG